MPRVLRHLLGVLILALALLGGYVLSLWPQGRGLVRLERLPGPAVVVRDRWGVPLIWGSSREAAFFAMGYAHAQDRLWEMEVLRRAAWGELASLAGDEALGFDASQRRMGFYRQALWLLPHLGEAQTLLRAYARGVTAYLRAHPTRLPPEFLLARLRPALWRVEDVVAIGAMVEWAGLPCEVQWAHRPREVRVGERSWPLAPTSQVRSLLAPLVVEATQTSGGMRCRMAWGTQPHTWVETGLMVGSGGFVRGWSIPGWPLPHAVAGRRGMLVRSVAPQDPWVLQDVGDWPEVLEFLEEDPGGPCDTVKASGPWSAVAPDGRLWWTTRGVLDSATVASGLALWWEDLPTAHAEAGPVSRAEEWSPTAQAALARVGSLGPWEGLWGGRVRGWGIEGCPGTPGEGPMPLQVVVEWAEGGVAATLLSGQSGVVGNPHCRDQRRAWRRGRVLSRDLRIPCFARGCALVPLVEPAASE